MMDRLSPEVLEQIFISIKNPSDLFNLRVVCKKWHDLITNERFLNLYFCKRLAIDSIRSLHWVFHRQPSIYPPPPDYNTLYAAPDKMKGTSSIVLINDSACNARIPSLIHSFINNDYSIGMWIHLRSWFEIVTFAIHINDFSLKCILKPKSFQLFCSRTGIFKTQTRIRLPYERWFYLVLTYSSDFRLYINGHVYPLISFEGPLVNDYLSNYPMNTDYNGYFILSFDGYGKILPIARFADIHMLPCVLTLNEIHAIIEQRTSIEKLNISNYLFNHWTNLHSYSNYFSNCILS